ncbi:MAG: NADH-quinone oxidoreductase subunit J, partial [Acidobacteria bacterium]|nr:NADH-quinone oxidoreductase subunit J [Acidobacteriota bacterium]
GVEERTNFSSLAKFAGLPLAAALLCSLAALVLTSHEQAQTAAQTGVTAPTKALSAQLFQEFVYPFELTSFLILVAIVGAIVLAQRDRKESHL